MKTDMKRMGLVLAAALMVLFGTINAALAWTLSGTVYGGSNQLAGATVTLTNATTLAQVASMTTDDNGLFSFSADNGSYNLLIAPPAGSGLTESTVNGVVVSGADVTQDIILIRQAVNLSGAVRTPGGAGIKNVQVMVHDQASGVQAGQVYTDANGNYSILLAGGSYSINLYGGTSVWGNCGLDGSYAHCLPNVATPQYFYGIGVVRNLAVSSTTTRDITLPLVTLSGKTTDSNGVAVGNVTVRQPNRAIYQSEGYYYVENDNGTAPIVSDASGSYSMNLLAGSGYSLTLVPVAGSGLAQTVVTGVDVTTNTARDLALQQAVNLSGAVRTPGGAGIKNVQVMVHDQASGVQAGQVYTDANGNYSIPLAGGSYSINLYGGTSVWGNCGLDGSYAHCLPNVATPQYFYGIGVVRNLAVSGTTTRDITLPIVTLSGKTTDSSGVAVGNVTIRQPNRAIYQSEGYYYVENDNGAAPIVSDGSGSYSMNLLAGTGYSLTLVPVAGSGLAQTVVTGVDVTTNTARDLALQQAVILSGAVRTPGGAGIKNVQVMVHDQISGVQAGQVYTDANGNYSIPLAGGSYSINLYGGTSVWGNCGLDGSYAHCLPNVTTPQYFYGIGVVRNLAVSGTTTRDITLPLVTLSGKTTDSNGVAVGNVTIRQPNRAIYQSEGYYYVENDNGAAPIVSDASGNYRMTLLAGTGYSETIIPPAGSGFAQTVLNNIDASTSLFQTIILSMPDTKAPVILSGPTVSSKTDSTASVEWQTNEPAKGGVLYGTNDPPTSSVSESAYGTSHSLQLTGLSPNTTYYLQVSASDAASNGPATSSVISFKTNPTPDMTAPVILTGPTVNTITHTSAVVEWTTDEPSTGSISYGPAGGSSQTVADAALATSHRVTLSGLSPETLYFLQVSATDAAGNVSAAKNASDFPTLAAPDLKVPVIEEGPMAINVSDRGATIVWVTDEPATSGVSWDDGTAHGVLSDNTLTKNHSVTITGLSATTSYNFTVSSKDAFGNGPALSTAKSFSTKAAPDSRPPVFIQTPIVKNTTHQSAVLYWETDEPASCTIQYGTSQSLGKDEAKAQLISKHNRPLTGLLPGTTYYFRIQASDAASNSASSEIYSFTTEVIPDTRAPVITEEASIIYSADTTATVAFKTDKPCDTVVNYGPNGSTGSQKSNSEKVNEHQVALTNLAPNTSYNVQVSCTDLSGNTVVASAGTPSTLLAMNYSFLLSDAWIGAPGKGFITKSQPDTTPPVISSTPRATATTSTMVRIHWLTDEIADSQVFYGLTGQSLSNSAGDIVKSAGHSVALTNLTPNTSYEFKVQSTDPSNNTVVSPVYSFTTAALADTRAPVISALAASGVTPSQISVSWNTDEPSTTVLKYGTTPFTLTAQVASAGARTEHAAALYNLVPGTTYYLAPVSSDGSGNSTQGETQSVTLAGQAPATFRVTAAPTAGGSVAPASQTVFSGYQLALAVLPSAGYLVNSVTGCGGTLAGNTYTTAAVSADCTVTASFSIDPNGPVPATPTTSAYPPAGDYSGGTLLVKLAASSPTATIRYTTDGSTPGLSSPAYSAPIPVTGTRTIKFFATEGSASEQVQSASYSVSATGKPGAAFAGLKPGTSFTVYRSEGGRSPSVVYSGSQASFSESVALKPNTIYSYTVASDLEGATDLLTIRTPLYSGWNIVAVPYDTTGVSSASFFASPVSSIYQWIPTGATAESSSSQLGSYRQVTALTPGLGYFVKASNSSTMLTYSGAAAPASVDVALKPGWTMIASPFGGNLSDIGTRWLIDGNVSLSSAVTGGSIGGSIYWWNGTTYDSWTILGNNPQVEPWKGYWIVNLDSVEHTLTIQ